VEYASGEIFYSARLTFLRIPCMTLASTTSLLTSDISINRRKEFQFSFRRISDFFRNFHFQRIRRSFDSLVRSRVAALRLRNQRPLWVRTSISRKLSRSSPDIHRGPRTLTPYYRRASGCDREDSVVSALSAPAKVPGRKEWSAKLYSDRKSRGIIPGRPVALERIARRDSIAAAASADHLARANCGSTREPNRLFDP